MVTWTFPSTATFTVSVEFVPHTAAPVIMPSFSTRLKSFEEAYGRAAS